MIQLDNRSDFNLTRMLLPLSYAALIGGTLTLIASPPNLIASSVLANAGYQDFHFFTFTPVGLLLLGLGVGYMVLMGRHLLPRKDNSPPRDLPGSGRDLLEAYGVAAIGHLFSIPRGSSLVGRRLRDSLLGTSHARVLLLERLTGFETLVRFDPDGDTRFSAGDVIVVVCADELAATLESELYLERRQLGKAEYDRWSRDLGTLVVLVHPDSALIGRSIQSVGFRSRYGLQVLGIRRRSEAITRLEDERMESGDALLLAGSWPRIQALQASPAGFVVLEPPREMEQYVPERRKAPIALGIVALMVAGVAFEVLPMVYSVLLAVGAGIATGCIKLDQAYRALPWSTIVVIAGLLPLAEALRVTGGADMIVGELGRLLWHAGPLHMLGGLFILTSVMGLVMPNVATAVLVAPMAIRAAENLQVQPQAFVMAVAVAASTAFIAPYSTPAANLVFEPGGYRFRDFVKVGFPLWLLSLGFSLLVLPLLFPFAA